MTTATHIKSRMAEMDDIFVRTLLIAFIGVFVMLAAAGYVNFHANKRVIGDYFWIHAIPFINVALALIVTIYRFKQATNVYATKDNYQALFREWMDCAKPLTFELVVIGLMTLVTIIKNAQPFYWAGAIFITGFSYALIVKAACGVKVEKD